MSSMNDAKKIVGYKAAEMVQDQMTVGLGTGSTAFFFIERLIQRCKEGLKIQAVSSSERSRLQAQEGNIELADINAIKSIDLTIDGADEIDPQKRMIKGGGGALLREKIVASSSKEMVVIIDETKLSDHLGKHDLPIEIVPFGYPLTIQKINKLGYQGALRKDASGKTYITDNGNHIYDIKFEKRLTSPEDDHKKLIDLPGVVETGLFFNLASKVIIAFSNGRIEVRN